MAHDPAGAVYGAALYGASVGSGSLDAASAALAELGAAIEGERGLASALYNPAFPDTGKKEILTQLTAGAPEIVRNSLLLLVDNGRLEALPDVIAEFDRRYQETKQQIELELTTAVPIADDEAERIRAELAAQSGRQVTLVRVVDPAIIGGLVLRLGDKLVDKSVRGRLDAMRLQLRSARLVGVASGGEN
jgi:F-type H+-transporting ATPase subunit delta